MHEFERPDDGVAQEAADMRAALEADREPNTPEEDLQALDVAGDAYERGAA